MQCGQCGGTAEGEINNNVKNSLCTSTKSTVSDKFWLCITRISVQTCTQISNKLEQMAVHRLGEAQPLEPFLLHCDDDDDYHVAE